MVDPKEVKPRTVKRNRSRNLISGVVLNEVGKRNQRELIEQYYVSLGATFERICEQRPASDPHAALIAQIKGLLSAENTWSNAYKIEQLIIPLYSDIELDIELKRQLLDAKYYFYPNVYAYYEEAKKALDNQGAGSPPEDQRHEREVLFSRLVKDLQWRRQLIDSGRDYARFIRIRSGMFFIVSVIIFLLVLIFLTKLPQYLLYLAMASGFIGASFSVLINLKKRLTESNYEELRVTYRWSYILTRGFIGLGAALIIFFFLKAELLIGPAFPVVAVAELTADSRSGKTLAPAESTAPSQIDPAVANQADTTNNPVSAVGGDAAAADLPPDGDDSDKKDENPEKERALLLIWCFLAGFSESLVPTLLKKTKEKATS